MSGEINLLPSKKKTVKKWTEAVKSGSMVALVLYVVLVAGLLGFSLFTSRRLSQVKAKEAVLEGQIKKEERKESLAFLLKDRLAKEKKIIDGRIDYEAVFDLFSQLEQPGLSFQEVEIVKGQLLLSGEAVNVASLKFFLDKVNNLSGKFSYVEISSLSRTKEGGYAFSLKTNLSF